jgi:DNA-binding ferritin-like protein
MKMKTRKPRKMKNKSMKKPLKKMKKMGTTNREKSHIVRVMLEMLNTVKLYHWKTRSYSQHKATDELYERLNENIDKFVEVLLGKSSSRINMVEKNIYLKDYSETSDFKQKIYEFREFLKDLSIYFNDRNDSDLLSIRDDILADINQFLYLMTLSGEP